MKPVYTSGGGHVCDTLATQSNNGVMPLNYAYAKESDGTYSQTDVDDTKAEVLAMDLAGCVLTGVRTPITGNAKDDDGTKVNIILKETDTVTIDGDKATLKGVGTITSDPPGGKGLPCTITFTSTGTRK